MQAQQRTTAGLCGPHISVEAKNCDIDVCLAAEDVRLSTVKWLMCVYYM